MFLLLGIVGIIGVFRGRKKKDGRTPDRRQQEWYQQQIPERLPIEQSWTGEDEGGGHRDRQRVGRVSAYSLPWSPIAVEPTDQKKRPLQRHEGNGRL